MAHRYGHPIAVTLATGQSDARPQLQPQSFLWAGRCYPIAEVIATWRLRDRWWDSTRAADRTYYRVCCRGPSGEQLFDLYHDVVTDCWVLDLAHD
jgi:hypothetical protein